MTSDIYLLYRGILAQGKRVNRVKEDSGVYYVYLDTPIHMWSEITKSHYPTLWETCPYPYVLSPGEEDES